MSYPTPENYLNSAQYGVIQSFDCKPAGGERANPIDPNGQPGSEQAPPCHVQGTNKWDGKYFPRLERGVAPNVQAPHDPSSEGSAQPQHYK